MPAIPKLQHSDKDLRNWRKLADDRAMATFRAILTAYAEQRNAIPDSDLDNEQPISLTINCTLGDIRNILTAKRCLETVRA